MKYNEFEKMCLKAGIKEKDLYNENRIPNYREIHECGNCKNSCIGKFIDDDLKDCINFIPKRISVEEKFLREHFSYLKK